MLPNVTSAVSVGKKVGVVVKVLLLLGIASIKNLSSFYY